jgi:hypothetical protein
VALAVAGQTIYYPASATHQLTQIDLTAEREVQELYGFLPNHKTSIHFNAHRVLGDTSPDVYFSHFTNKTFLDLNPGKSLPVAAAFLLGFGLKFIPIQKKSLRLNKIDEGINRFNRDMFLKIHFAGDDEDDEPYEKLQVKSTWKPDQPPNKIPSRLSKFECTMKKQLVPCHGKPNLTKFQAGILKKICNNKNVIIAHADKNLGPVEVDAKQYI